MLQLHGQSDNKTKRNKWPNEHKLWIRKTIVVTSAPSRCKSAPWSSAVLDSWRIDDGTYKIRLCQVDPFRKIKHPETHADCRHDGVKRRERSLTENRSQGFRRPRQRLGRIDVQPDSHKAQEPHDAGMDKGTPVDAVLLPDQHVDDEQHYGGH